MNCWTLINVQQDNHWDIFRNYLHNNIEFNKDLNLKKIEVVREV